MLAVLGYADSKTKYLHFLGLGLSILCINDFTSRGNEYGQENSVAFIYTSSTRAVS